MCFPTSNFFRLLDIRFLLEYKNMNFLIWGLYIYDI